MKTYFIVLRLPGDEELKFRHGKICPVDFWEKARRDINAGNSEIVSIRHDTGISEDLRAHLAKAEGFTTYLIFHTCLTEEQAHDRMVLLSVAKHMIEKAQREVIVDYNEHFQLVSIDQDDQAA